MPAAAAAAASLTHSCCCVQDFVCHLSLEVIQCRSVTFLPYCAEPWAEPWTEPWVEPWVEPWAEPWAEPFTVLLANGPRPSDSADAE